MARHAVIERVPVGPLQANAYLLARDGRAVLIDPGGEPERLLEAVTAAHARLEAIWLTHADFDHVGGLAGLLRAAPVPVYLHPADLDLLRSAADVAAAFGVAMASPPTATLPLRPGEDLDSAGLRAHCLFTPGHTPGHMAFHLPSEGVVFTGDALFRGSIGRVDRPGGDGRQLLASIREQLLVLPPETRVLPGHGPETTIGGELAGNPFLAPG